MSVGIVGAAGKIASIITMNPSLNDLAIKGLLIGATLAITPTAALKLAEKLQWNIK